MRREREGEREGSGKDISMRSVCVCVCVCVCDCDCLQIRKDLVLLKFAQEFHQQFDHQDYDVIFQFSR